MKFSFIASYFIVTNYDDIFDNHLKNTKQKFTLNYNQITLRKMTNHNRSKVLSDIKA